MLDQGVKDMEGQERVMAQASDKTGQGFEKEML